MLPAISHAETSLTSFSLPQRCVSVARTQNKNIPINKIILYVERATDLYHVNTDIDVDSDKDVTVTPATNLFVAVGKSNVLLAGQRLINQSIN